MCSVYFQIWMKISSFVRNCHYNVMSLEPNKKYQFRVRAENQYGVSEPLTLEEPIIAKVCELCSSKVLLLNFT